MDEAVAEQLMAQVASLRKELQHLQRKSVYQYEVESQLRDLAIELQRMCEEVTKTIDMLTEGTILDN